MKFANCAMLGLVLVGFSGARANAASTVIDFSTGDELTTRFRSLANSGPVQSNGAVSLIQASGAATYVYDANGTTAGATTFSMTPGASVTVSADLNLTASNASFGFYFINAANEASTSSYLALFNLNYSGGNGTTDQFRFSSDANPSSTGANAGGLPAGRQTLVDAGVTTSTTFNLSATYTVLTENSFQLSMTAGTQTVTSVFTSVTPLSEVEVGFRANPNTSTAGSTMDNFTVTYVPEPSSLLLGVVGALGLMGVRRRS